MLDDIRPNTVGYTNDGLVQSQWKPVCSQFLKIGTDGSTMKVGDLVAGGNFKGTDSIKFVDTECGLAWTARWIPEATMNAIKKSPVYSDVTTGEGWYKVVNNVVDYRQCLNDEPLPFGCCILANSGNTGAFVASNGEVAESETGFLTHALTQSQWKYIGNCTPLPLKLSQFVAGGNFKGTDSIKYVDTECGLAWTARWIPEATMNAIKKSPVYSDVTTGEGWYKVVDNVVDYRQCMNDIDIPAGSGILANSGNTGAYITIPSAL